MLLFGLLFTIASCSNDDETNTPATLDVESEAAFDEEFEEIDVITEAGMTLENATGRVDEEDEILACSTVTRDADNNTITIDFGVGCEGRGGRIRAGKLMISYSDRRYIPGATRSISFDSVRIEGIRTMTNVAASLDDNPRFNIVLVGGRATFDDGTFATRDANHTRTWVRTGSPITDESIIEGSASGIDRNGDEYSINITTSLIYRRECHSARAFIPVEGIQEIIKGENNAIIDYGDGGCDNSVTITVNGVTEVKEISSLRIGRRIIG